LPEIGRHEIHLALEPFTGEQPEATAVRAARRLNRPLRMVGTGVHIGDLPLAAKLVSVDCDHAAISGLKRAERDQALLVRLYETDGRAAEATLFLNSGILGQATDVFEADLHENPLDSTRARIDGDRIRVALEPHSIKTLLVKLGRHAR
jgi:alpha-mannosidase